MKQNMVFNFHSESDSLEYMKHHALLLSLVKKLLGKTER